MAGPAHHKHQAGGARALATLIMRLPLAAASGALYMTAELLGALRWAAKSAADWLDRWVQ